MSTMSRAEQEPIRVGALTVRFVADPGATGGAASVFECHVPANAKMPAPHSHDGFDEINYGLRGVTTFTVDGREVPVGPGEAVVIPRGAVHAFRNVGDEDAAFLAVATPGGRRRASGPRGGRAGHGASRADPRPAGGLRCRSR